MSESKGGEMKKAAGLVVVFLVLVFLAGRPASAGDIAQIEEYGSINLVPTFVVVIGTPHFDSGFERSALVRMVGIYLANAKFFIRLPDGGWVVQERHLPDKEKFTADDLLVQKEAVDEDMPTWFRILPQRLRDNIESFLGFYSGAFRIYLVDQSRENAEELARVINAAT